MVCANCPCMPTATAMSPSALVTTASRVGAFGFVRSSLHPAAAARVITAAAAPAAARTSRPSGGRGAAVMFGLCVMVRGRSVGEVDADDELARQRRGREVDAARDGLRREEVDLGVEPAVVR